MGQATEVYTREFDTLFHKLPTAVQRRIELKINLLGRLLTGFPHERLQGRPEFRLRVGDYLIIYRFDAAVNELYLVTLGHRRDVYR